MSPVVAFEVTMPIRRREAVAVLMRMVWPNPMPMKMNAIIKNMW